MKWLFASLGFAAMVGAVSLGGCAQGGDAPAIDDGDGGTSTTDGSHDGAEGGDCPTPCTEGTPYCDRATRKCVSCLPTKDTCPVTTYCQQQTGGGYKCVVGCKTSAADCPNAEAGTVACCDHSCVDTQSSLFNCGACGKHCGGPHITGSSCSFGQCTGTCDFGYSDCNNDKSDGCESQTSNDPKNCGSCGHDCTGTLHYASATCSSGVCTGGTCVTGYGDCNQSSTDGCEAQLNTPQHCGSCTNVCNVQNATATCTGTTCDYGTCNQDYQDCDGNRANGCESSKLGDSNNCNGCGNRCPTGQSCANGMCVNATGTVLDVQGVSHAIMIVPCGNGTLANCTQTVAETSCTSIGRKLVAHASNGTTGVISLGATTSCNFSIGYFTNSSQALAGQCLIGISNASWSQCCTLGSWHGNTVVIPTTLGQQFGYVYSTNSGYNANLTNTTGTTWGCQTSTSPPTGPTCSAYNVACE